MPSFSPSSQVVLTQLLNQMPPHIAATFDHAQLNALEKALAYRSQQNHAVDIRLSVPLPWHPLYLVLLIGEERRSLERRRQERQMRPFASAGNTLVILGSTFFGGLILFALLQISGVNFSRFSNLSEQVAPAGIPFKADRQSCERSGRTWQNNECFDFEHDPRF